MKKAEVDRGFALQMDFGEALQRYSKVNTKTLQNDEIQDECKEAAPFIKWVGGKRSIIGELKERVPAEYTNYYEPFLGGGALFYELYKDIKKAFLSDMNFDLVIAYTVIKKDPAKLIELLKVHQKNHSETYYYQLRAKHELQDPIEIAARFIYLNKTCFNGLFRVNSKGEFNVPMGKYNNPAICSEDNINAVHKALRKATIEYKDFKMITPNAGDFVYFDPPYHPTDETSFTAYSKLGFTEKDQTELRDFAVELHKKGVKVMLSNSNTKFINSLYKGSIFKIGIVNAPRLVNCKPNGRNAVEEVLITNY